MKKILLLSDTHSHIDEAILEHVAEADEVWHGGDIGNSVVVDKIQKLKPLLAVYGNIDNNETRSSFPLNQVFTCEGVKVVITHIAGYPGNYSNRALSLIKEHQPDIFICGHSHICKVIYDKKLKHFHFNPGACGHFGFHKFRTMLRFECVEGELKNLELIELGMRGRQ